MEKNDTKKTHDTKMNREMGKINKNSGRVREGFAERIEENSLKNSLVPRDSKILVEKKKNSSLLKNRFRNKIVNFGASGFLEILRNRR